VEEALHTGGFSDQVERKRKAAARPSTSQETAFGSPRDYLDNQHVYTVVSARARGLAVGINMCPDKECNFSCIYCEVHRNGEAPKELDVQLMATELRRTLACVREGVFANAPEYTRCRTNFCNFGMSL
jgi:hypothetical protein